MTGKAELYVQYQRLTAEREALRVRYNFGEKDLFDKIQDLSSQIRVTLTQIESLEATASSGAVVRDDQAAKVDRANDVNPGGGLLTSDNGRIKPAPDTTSASNASRFDPALINDFGTDAELRPYRQTQGTQVGAGQTSSGPMRDDAGGGAVPSGAPGVGAPSDDSSGASTIVSSLNAIDWSDKIDPLPNVLDQYASYTYQASLYLMDKATYQQSINTGSKNLAGAKLLVQSGGAPQGSGRNDFFNLDYYIDRFDIKSFIAGKSVRLSHNVKEITMTIVEPNGISFIQNLDAAVQQFLGSPENKKRNFTSQIYLFVVRFYGYDDQGNLVRGGNAANGTSDPNAFVEKWFPLIFSKVGFRVASKVVEYEIVAKAPPYQINASSQRGTIPYNVEFSGKTLKDVLGGPAAINSTSAPANASAATTNKKTVRQSLVTALNEYQQKLKNDGVIQHPDEYNIEFMLDSMASATIINPGLNKSATSMATPGTPADQKLGSKQSMDPNSQTTSATAGMQIVQFIDNMVKNSSYVRDQQTLIINANNGTETAGPGVNLKNTAWYKIGFKAEPKFDQYDEKRNDYAYKITYTIAPYKISQLNSTYFKPPVFNGVHKTYKYWFTGQNTGVLSYEENLNSLYYLVLTNTNLAGLTSSVSGAENINELLKYAPSTTSGQPTTGAEGRANEPGANAADQLYNPGDLKECNMTIVGDPAWLQQGEAFVSLPKGDPYYFRAFLSDGTINFDSQQILFEIAFNAPRDYNLATGLIQPSADKLNSTTQLDQVTQTPGTAQFSRVYIAKECTSSFNKGKFTQELKGSLMVFYPPSKGEGRPAPQDIRTASNQAAPAKTKAPVWKKPTPGTKKDGITNLANTSLQAAKNEVVQGRVGVAEAQAILENGSERDIQAFGGRAYLQSIINSTPAPGAPKPNQLIVKDQ